MDRPANHKRRCESPASRRQYVKTRSSQRFPLRNFHGEMWARCDKLLYTQLCNIYDKLWQILATRAHLNSNIATCREMWPFCENPVQYEMSVKILWKPRSEEVCECAGKHSLIELQGLVGLKENVFPRQADGWGGILSSALVKCCSRNPRFQGSPSSMGGELPPGRSPLHWTKSSADKVSVSNLSVWTNTH